jgi:hypothetical protein
MRNALRYAIRALAPLLVIALIPFAPGGTSRTEAGADPIVVDTTADGGGGSFRQALDTAAGQPGADTITFDPTVFPPGNPATINANANYIIEAPAASEPLTIDATGAGVIFDFTGVTEGSAAFHFRPDGPIDGLVLKNFTIQNFTSDTNHEGHGVEIGFAPTSVSNLVIENMTIKGNSADGLFLNADENFSGLIEGNDIRDNDGNGIHITSGTTSGLFIQSNDIVGNGSKGIDLDVIDDAVASTAFINQNTITGNGSDAIFIGGPETTNAMHAQISQNSTSGNGGLGINLLAFVGSDVTENDAGDTDAGVNDLLNFPVLNGTSPSGVTGTACASCTIEIFLSDNDDSDHGEGKTFLGSGNADGGGNFDVEACASQGASVTATATDSLNNTSEFSLNYTVPASTCSGVLLQGDLDCEGDVDTRDVLIAFIYVADTTQLTREEDCPSVGGTTVPLGSADVGPQGGVFFGDVGCDGVVNLTDAIVLLQHIAEVTLSPEPDGSCIHIGEPLLQ